MAIRSVLFLSLLYASITFAQTKPITAEEQRLAEMEQLESRAADLPVVKADSIPQLVKITVEEKMLVARTSFSSVDGAARVIVPGLRGIVRLTSYGRIEAAESGRNFQVDQRDLTDPVAGDIHTTIVALVGRVIISRDAENAQYVSSVQLVQDPPPPPGGEVRDPPVKLYVSRTDQSGKEKDFKLHLAADDFFQLRQLHDREVDQYLRPIIRDFKQEAEFFAIDPFIAWQVLGSAYSPDEKTTSHVNILVT